ncbi:hypothetical protein BHE74_00017647 [Ensete ventricosum]|nr:hypothetical protein BHE74_00017647 [Ensete ventricosum]
MESLINLVRVELIYDRSVVVNPSFWKALKYRTSAELPVLIITLFTLALTMWTETTKVSLWPGYSVSLASKAIFAHPLAWDASLQWLEHRPSGPMHYLCLTSVHQRSYRSASLSDHGVLVEFRGNRGGLDYDGSGRSCRLLGTSEGGGENSTYQASDVLYRAIYARKAMTFSARSELTSKASSVGNRWGLQSPLLKRGRLEALGRESVGSPWMPEVELVGALLPVPMVALSAE